MLLRLQLRLSSPLWLGPAYLPARPSLVCVRENAILFDHASSYQSSSFAKRGEIFLADSELRVLDGYSMVCADCGAIEAQFVRLAASTDFQCKTSLVVLDLDSGDSFNFQTLQAQAGLVFDFLEACVHAAHLLDARARARAVCP